MRFLVQVTKSRNEKSAYKTRYSLEDKKNAIWHYNCFNIGRGYKARIVQVNDDGTKKVLARKQ